MNTEEKQELRNFLSEHTTLVLSTLGENGSPAAAALFYAEDPDLNLYFISDSQSEHSSNLEHSTKVAVVIAADGQDWKELNGVQMKGNCAKLKDKDRTRADTHYLSKFSFVLQNSMLRNKIEQSDFYVIKPEWIRVTDNRPSFADKREWRIEN